MIFTLSIGKPQKIKSLYFSGPATKRGGGGKGLATKKIDFFESHKCICSEHSSGIPDFELKEKSHKILNVVQWG